MPNRQAALWKTLPALAALAFAAPCAADLSISDTLINYQLYGKSWIRIEGDAETSPGGDVGSDSSVELSNNNVVVGGNLHSGGEIKAMRNVDVAGNLNARGNVHFTDNNSSIAGSTNVGGRLSIIGGDPTGNVFGGPMKIKEPPIDMAAWGNNTYNGAVRVGPVHPGNAPPGVQFNTNDPLPPTGTRFPDTTVDFDGSKGCSTADWTVFNMSMCGFGGSPADTILPPGRYGDFLLRSNNTLYMTSGTYHFKSFEMLSDGTKVLFLQPGSGFTRVLVQDYFTVHPGNQLVAPVRHTEPGFNKGTVLIYVQGVVRLMDDNRIWASVVGRNHVFVESGLRLYGQVLGGSLSVENGFKGGVGFGRFIPLAEPKGKLKYSIIHFKHKD